MTSDSQGPGNGGATGGVTIGDVEGGLQDTIIAGRDVSIGQRITQVFGFGLEQQRAQRNRRTMLQLVKNYWVKGVLEQSLYGAAMIELGLEERADAIELPWDMVLQTPDQPRRTLPTGTRIVNVFDRMNGALLILGEPGSGKTTVLLELVRDMIGRAERDPTEPIPVVFNLSSWAENRQPIAEWLVDELNTKYSIPKRIARPWVENDDLLLLFDGLDEVRAENREECVKAINDFRQEHMMPLVVCSRIADYEALTTQLRLQGAVLLQPLTPYQIDQYLGGTGTQLLALCETLLHDTAIQQLAQSPLMLSVMTLAYRGLSVTDLEALETLEARRTHMLHAFVQRMFERRGTEQPYSREQTIHWLVWLAWRMSEHAQSVFVIERLQPSWLDTYNQKRLYAVGSRLTTGLLVGLLGGFFLTVSWKLSSAVMPGGRGPYWLLFALRSGLTGSLVFGLGGLVIGSIVGFINAGKFAEEGIDMIEAVQWSWAIVRSEMRKRYRAALREFACPGVLSDTAPLTLATRLASALPTGLSSVMVEEERIDYSRGLRQSMKYALLVGFAGALYGVLYAFFIVIARNLNSFGAKLFLVGLKAHLPVSVWLSDWLPAAVVLGSVLGTLWGLRSGLRFGGLACIQHFIVRLILYRRGYIPWNYVRFLDYATERVFLRRVGGGYIFVHRLLQEHFAAKAAEGAS